MFVVQPCPTLCDPVDCSPPGSSVHGDSPGKNTGVGCYSLLQGIFPTQGSNGGLLCDRWILYCLSHQRSPNLLDHPLKSLQGSRTGQGQDSGARREGWIITLDGGEVVQAQHVSGRAGRAPRPTPLLPGVRGGLTWWGRAFAPPPRPCRC